MYINTKAFHVVNWKSPIQIFNGRHHELDISHRQMTPDVFMIVIILIPSPFPHSPCLTLSNETYHRMFTFMNVSNTTDAMCKQDLPTNDTTKVFYWLRVAWSSNINGIFVVFRLTIALTDSLPILSLNIKLCCHFLL